MKWKPDKLYFANPGIPKSTPKSGTEAGITHVAKLGLDAMEIEWTHSIYTTAEKAPDIKKAAEENNVILTCHAPFYINLNSLEPAKKYASIHRIVKSAEILQMCGGWSVCYHAGFYMKMDPKKVYKTMVKRFADIDKELKKKNITDVWVRPETTGKPSQFGSFDELLNLCKETNTLPVVDFSHVHARDNGGFNSTEEWREMMTKMEKKLGKTALDNMHIHLSGIQYGEKGEQKHLNLPECDMNWKDLIKVWEEFKLKGVVVSESPNIEKDALLIKKTYGKS
jgi:deoxyribonuclease-4